MSVQHPFGGMNVRPSPWGYNWTAMEEKPPQVTVNHAPPAPESPSMMDMQYANMPAALLSTMKREKKPFTYTPGGVNLSDVLNARLQKRMERKKKYVEEKERDFEPPKQVIVSPTYNSALDMYSMQNALEALEVQAELVAADKSLSSGMRSATLPRNHTFRFEDKDMDPGRGVAQSKAFRVLQIITDTEEDPRADNSHGYHQDEMRFTGIRDSKSIPSRFFQTLQKITGTDKENEEDQQQQPSRTAPPADAIPRPTSNERKSFPVSRPPFLSQQTTPPQQQQQAPPPEVNSVPGLKLKRPAAFLPIKTTPSFSSKAPSSGLCSNGPLRKSYSNMLASAGTDF